MTELPWWAQFCVGYTVTGLIIFAVECVWPVVVDFWENRR